MRGSDAGLRRVERTAVAWCAAVAALTVVARGGRLDVAAGVVGGGLLVGFSYWATKAWVDRLTTALAATGGGRDDTGQSRGGRRAQAVSGAVLLVGRYALLGLAAYVMMARLRLHPVGLLLGASSVAAAAAIEAVRTTRS